MLTLLHIRDFAIVDDLELELGEGFSAITGETGAGKSILVEALGLLLGSRADTAGVRAGTDRAELVAAFQLDEQSEALAWLRDNEMQDGNRCLLRRVISQAARSRAWINGTPVTLAQVQELGALLVEIHGQNEHLKLADSAEQLRLLDTGHGGLDAVQQAFAAWRESEDGIARLDAEDRMPPGEIDLIEHQVLELQSAAADIDAYGELEAEHRLLARGGDVLQNLQFALDALDADDGGIGPLLQRLAERVMRDAAVGAEVGNAGKALSEAAINCEEARASLQAALSRIDLSPERLADLDARIARAHALARRHRVAPQQLPGVLAELRGRCERAANREERRRELEQQRDRHLAAYREAAAVLHSVRARRAAELSGSVTALIQELGMPGGVFEIAARHEPDAPPSRRGDDRVALLVSANPGVPPGPLRKIASGGELSRISLAVKVAVTAERAPPTQVFDEVDAGIGGAAASAVGRLLRSVAALGQVLCVTHLAQVAVCADQQIRVLKRPADGAPGIETRPLQGRERIDEIARMLGGQLSEQSRAHASELLASAVEPSGEPAKPGDRSRARRAPAVRTS